MTAVQWATWQNSVVDELYRLICETQRCSNLEVGKSRLAVFCIKATYPVAVVTDLDDGFVLSQVPHNCFPTGAGRGQDVLNLPVPGHDTDVFSRLKAETKAVTVKTNLTLCLRQTDHWYPNADTTKAVPCKRCCYPFKWPLREGCW